MSALVLVHHVYDGRKETSVADHAEGWSTVPCPDAPPVTAAMDAALRPRLTDRSSKPGSTVTWHHCDGNAWAAVTDLHRRDQHDDATALARLLRWCDSRFTRRVEGMWEIREVS